MSAFTKKVAVITVVAVTALVAVALTAALSAGIRSRVRQEQKRNDAAAEVATAMPRVTVAGARSTASEAEQVFPGSALPLLEAGLYPRATGYIKTRLVDIGDRVQEGQLLAVIDAGPRRPAGACQVQPGFSQGELGKSEGGCGAFRERGEPLPGATLCRDHFPSRIRD